MMQGPFLFALMPKGCFYGFFRGLFLFRCSFEPEAASCIWPLAHEWHKPSPTAGKPGRMIYPPDRTSLAGHIKSYFLAGGLPGFTLPTMSFFGGTSFFHGFLFWSFLSNLPLLPFTSIFAPFSESHQAVISVLGAKVTPGFDGKARSSLLFSGKISSPSGSIFPKNSSIICWIA